MLLVWLRGLRFKATSQGTEVQPCKARISIPGEVHFTREEAEGLAAASHVGCREDAAHHSCKGHQAPRLVLSHPPVHYVPCRESVCCFGNELHHATHVQLQHQAVRQLLHYLSVECV